VNPKEKKPPEIGATIRVRLYNSLVVTSTALAIVETSSGQKIRIRSGDVVTEISTDQVL
jgi:hypothetical protein